jgi:hypothetical protein
LLAKPNTLSFRVVFYRSLAQILARQKEQDYNKNSLP